MDFTFQNIPRRFTIDLGPKGPRAYVFFIYGDDLEKACARKINKSTGKAPEYNEETKKTEQVTYVTELDSVDFKRGHMMIMLATMTEKEIRELVTKKILTEEELERQYSEQMGKHMNAIRDELFKYRTALEKQP